MLGSAAIELFSTCPQSKDSDGARYRRQVAEIARWSEEVGCKGILVRVRRLGKPDRSSARNASNKVGGEVRA